MSLLSVTSNIWGTRFQLQPLSDSLPRDVGSVVYRSSVLHLNPRQMTVKIRDLTDWKRQQSLARCVVSVKRMMRVIRDARKASQTSANRAGVQLENNNDQSTNGGGSEQYTPKHIIALQNLPDYRSAACEQRGAVCDSLPGSAAPDACTHSLLAQAGASPARAEHQHTRHAVATNAGRKRHKSSKNICGHACNSVELKRSTCACNKSDHDDVIVQLGAASAIAVHHNARQRSGSGGGAGRRMTPPRNNAAAPEIKHESALCAHVDTDSIDAVEQRDRDVPESLILQRNNRDMQLLYTNNKCSLCAEQALRRKRGDSLDESVQQAASAATNCQRVTTPSCELVMSSDCDVMPSTISANNESVTSSNNESMMSSNHSPVVTPRHEVVVPVTSRSHEELLTSKHTSTASSQLLQATANDSCSKTIASQRVVLLQQQSASLVDDVTARDKDTPVHKYCVRHRGTSLEVTRDRTTSSPLLSSRRSAAGDSLRSSRVSLSSDDDDDAPTPGCFSSPVNSPRFSRRFPFIRRNSGADERPRQQQRASSSTRVERRRARAPQLAANQQALSHSVPNSPDINSSRVRRSQCAMFIVTRKRCLCLPVAFCRRLLPCTCVGA